MRTDGLANISELVTKDDVRDMRDSIVEEMRAGFTGVYARQDKTNGRVQATEVVTATQDVRLKNIEREVFRRRMADKHKSAVPESDGPSRTIRQWDVTVFLGGVAAAIGLLKGLEWLGPLLVKVANS